MNFDKLPAPIWADGGDGEKVAYEIILDLIEEHRHGLPSFSEAQVDELVQLMWKAMDRGWDAAMMASRYKAVRGAGAKRSAAADSKRATILATYDRMAQAGDVTMQAVADACGVHVATVYRAMNGKKPKRR